MSTELSIIVAMAKGRVIGRHGTLPWHYSEDLKHFKRTTLGHPIIMGRKTFESIGRALPKRRNIVVSRTMREAPEGIELCESLGAAIELAGTSDDQAFVIGGARIYEEALQRATRLYVTEIDVEVEGDVFFPELPEGRFREVERRAGDTEGLTFVTFERV